MCARWTQREVGRCTKNPDFTRSLYRENNLDYIVAVDAEPTLRTMRQLKKGHYVCVVEGLKSPPLSKRLSVA